MESKTFRTNLNCGKCRAKVTPLLAAEPWIRRWDLNTEDSRKPLTVEAETVQVATLRQAVEKAGFQLFEEISLGPQPTSASWKTYFPLLLIFVYLVIGTLLMGYQRNEWHAEALMAHFMGGFFIVFSFFKFLNLRGFAEAYRTYDLVAKAIPAYGFIYPFVELALGLAYIMDFQPILTNAATLVVMGASTLGVAQALKRKSQIQCACLGTVFKLPMTKVTLFEDLLMVAMSAAMLGMLV